MKKKQQKFETGTRFLSHPKIWFVCILNKNAIKQDASGK